MAVQASFEYKTICTKKNLDEDILDYMFKIYFKDGWELVTDVLDSKNDFIQGISTYYFKRVSRN